MKFEGYRAARQWVLILTQKISWYGVFNCCMLKRLEFACYFSLRGFLVDYDSKIATVY